MPYSDLDTKRAQDRQRRRERTAVKQDIAKRLAPVKNPSRRRKACKSFRFFAETYFPPRFDKPWSDDHLRVIAMIEDAVLRGGKLAVAMPRGSGKTTLVEIACLWAVLIGARLFVALIGSDKAAALEMLDSIKSELETNELLAEDFPREVGPFQLLEGEARRAKGQTFEGQRTHIIWRAETIVFGTVPKSLASGGIIRVAGITGRVRGMKFTRPDGKVARPDLCVPDDPQTDQSAASTSQTDYRERVLLGAVKGLAGPGRRISILMPCTVIRRGDLAERFFDRKRHPQWDGVRMKALYSFPTNMKLWEEYAQLYRDSRQCGGDGSEATKFYKAHRKEMDAGAKPAWPARFEAPAELSAVQSCMNLFLFTRAAFFAEHQNEPEEETLLSGKVLASTVLSKLNGRPRGEVPQKCRWLVGHVDVHDELLYWHVVAAEPGFTPYTIDYGTWPGQPDRYFSQSNPRMPLSKAYPGRTKEGVIYAGLEDFLGKHLLPRQFRREDGAGVSLDAVGVDCGYKPDEVAKVIRALGQGGRVFPTKGFPMSAARKPFTEYKQEPGQILGRHWRRALTKATGLLTLEMDVNRWKSFARDRVMAPKGDASSWSVFGKDPAEHQLLADQYAAQVPVRNSGPWGEIDIWTLPPNRPDDHWWDDLVDALCVLNALPGGPKLPEWERGKGVRREEKGGGRKAVKYL
jgi:hypothetical protein